MSNADFDSAVSRAETMLSQSPVAAVAILERAAEDPSCPAEMRAEALAMLAQHIASTRSERGFTEARAYLSRAEALSPEGGQVRGRIALARGYIAFREAQDTVALDRLNEAASLLKDTPRLRARVLDTLGMLLSRRGDLDGAHELLTMAIELKRADPAGADPHSLALTYGNLGRLELTRGRFTEAEACLRQDLALILAHDPKPATEAHVRSQLAQAIDGQCPGREADVRAELERARKLAPRGSVTSLYVLKNVVLLSLRESRQSEARRALDELREAMAKQRFAEFDPWLALLEGRVRRAEGTSASLERAAPFLEEAWKLFVARQMPQEAVEAALEWAEVLSARGETKHAIAALGLARQALEAPEAQREALLARLEARLSTLGNEGLLSSLQARLRRVLGGVADAAPSTAGSSDGIPGPEPSPSAVTVCVIEVRGMAELWAQQRPADLLLARAARIFGALADAVTALGATPDRMGPDRLVLHFPGGSAVGRAVEAVARASSRLAELHAEHAHLGEPPLSLAASVAVGWARRQTVTSGGCTERGFWGPAVASACDLASRASPGEVVIDEAAEASAPPSLRTRLARLPSSPRSSRPVYAVASGPDRPAGG